MELVEGLSQRNSHDLEEQIVSRKLLNPAQGIPSLGRLMGIVVPIMFQRVKVTGNDNDALLVKCLRIRRNGLYANR